jgi:protein O-GlcNAc transferase
MQSMLQDGLALHKAGQLSRAGAIYEQILQRQPRHFDALHLLGVIAAQTGNPSRAAELIGKAIEIDQTNSAAYSNRGNALRALGQLQAALESYDRAIELKPDSAEALNNRGNVLRDLRRPQAALESHDRAIALRPDYAEAFSNRGNALCDLKQPQAALESYNRAIALKPDYADAFNNRGNALLDLKQPQAALESYNRAIMLKPDYADAFNNRGNALRDLKQPQAALESFERAIALKPNFAEAFNNRGNPLLDLKQGQAALESYERAIALQPDYALAFNNRGKALQALRQPQAALENYDRAVALKPDLAEAFSNRGNALMELRQPKAALESYDRALALKPDFAEAYYNRGLALGRLDRPEEEIRSYEQASALKQDLELLYGDLIHAKKRICDWSHYEAQVARIVESVQRGQMVIEPYPLLFIADSPALQRKATETVALAKNPPNNALPKIAIRNSRNKINIGYFSADFREHNVAFLTAELFEKHDRSRFEVTAFSFGVDTGDGMRQRLNAAFDRFIDVRDRSDMDVALLARTLEIDIAINLGGFTEDCRTEIFAARAAPVQVNYLGYSGTMGVPYMDYLIADTTVIPEGQQKHYTEKIAYLPNSYMSSDSKRPISDRVFDRAKCGLPQSGIVFCFFSDSYKLNPDIFDCWMRILRKVESSVLWLSHHGARTSENLRKEASTRGIDPDRLVFADRLPLRADHLARHQLADLFLDTLPCNAHTTANDALWVGVPILTQMGASYAGRSAASLLNAIALPELIASTRQEYESLAIELASNPEELASIRRKLASNRLSTPLFDMAVFTRHIEAAYTEMYYRHQAGLLPKHIYVAR